MNDTAFELLESMVGTPVWRPGIAIDMLMMSFGAPVTRTMLNGRPFTTGELALHIMCAWRLVQGNALLVGASDYNHHDEEERETARTYITQRLDSIFANEATLQGVERLAATAFRLHLSSGVVVEAFPARTRRNEYWEDWRVFRSGEEDGPHLVVRVGELE